MAGQHGTALYLRWLTSSGTTVLSGDFTQFNYAPSIDLVEETAGSDPYKKRIPGVKDGTASLTFYHQTGGSVVLSELAAGKEGTLEYSAEGTATGKQKRSIPAISMGPQQNQPYSDIIEISVTFQQNGADSVAYH